MQTGFMRGGRGKATGCISQCIMTALSLPLSLSLRSWPCQTSLEASKISQLQQQQEQQQHMLAVRCSSPVGLLEHAAPSHSLSNGGGRQVRGSMEVWWPSLLPASSFQKRWIIHALHCLRAAVAQARLHPPVDLVVGCRRGRRARGRFLKLLSGEPDRALRGWGPRGAAPKSQVGHFIE